MAVQRPVAPVARQVVRRQQDGLAHPEVLLRGVVHCVDAHLPGARLPGARLKVAQRRAARGLRLQVAPHVRQELQAEWRAQQEPPLAQAWVQLGVQLEAAPLALASVRVWAHAGARVLVPLPLARVPHVQVLQPVVRPAWAVAVQPAALRAALPEAHLEVQLPGVPDAPHLAVRAAVPVRHEGALPVPRVAPGASLVPLQQLGLRERAAVPARE